MKVKKMVALSAALLTISCISPCVFADTIAERDGLKYLVSDSGKEKGLYSGWTKKGDKHYYYKDGVMKKNCWIKSGGQKKYYLRSDGTRAEGAVTVMDIEYRFDEKGELILDGKGMELIITPRYDSDYWDYYFSFTNYSEAPVENFIESYVNRNELTGYTEMYISYPTGMIEIADIEDGVPDLENSVIYLPAFGAINEGGTDYYRTLTPGETILGYFTTQPPKGK